MQCRPTGQSVSQNEAPITDTEARHSTILKGPGTGTWIYIAP